MESSSLAESPAGSAGQRGVVLRRRGLSPAADTYGTGRERWCWGIGLQTCTHALPVPSKSLLKVSAEELL